MVFPSHEVLGISILLNVRQHLRAGDQAQPVLSGVLWDTIDTLKGEELDAALLLVNVASARTLRNL